ncbi:MAG: diaminopimelate epimerase [Elusimicrobiaceae bacterium]|nr:diaminopimelate epimerase [Elusimicrobiaceae bacterium]
MHFVKYHGLGNDFVIVDMSKNNFSDFARVAKAVCDRRRGIGADGLVLLWTMDGENVKMRIFNSDGSEAEMCGNVSRCVPLFWKESGYLKGNRLTLHTLAGPIITEIIDGQKGLVRVDMGAPRLTRGEIPVAGNPSEKAIGISLQAAGQTWTGTAVSMGNPHFVVFVQNVEEIDLSSVGPAVETHADFPRKTNVEFVQKLDDNTLRMRVWERGVGITQACGTGACATLVAAVLNNLTQESARVILDGGELQIAWPQRGHVLMTGPAQKVFEGEYVL